MPPPPGRDVHLLVEEVYPRESEHGWFLEFKLEDGRIFRLYAIPPEVASAVNKIREGRSFDIYANRESVFDALVDLKDLIKELLDSLEKVVINEFNVFTGLYTATVEFNLRGIILRKKMIPSHAIYLALLANKPIYVSKRLVDEQERIMQRLIQLSEELEHEHESEESEGEEEGEEEEM